MDREQAVASVVKALRRVNFQGSVFGQSVAIRLGLSESDIEALELLIDGGAATAGKLAEVLGMTTGAVTRVIDRLEQAGYVRRTADPADRRRVVIEVVPERAATLESMMSSLERAAEDEIGAYTPEQLETINAFLGRMAELTGAEAARLRSPSEMPSDAGPAEHVAARGGLTEASLMFRSGAQELRLRSLGSATDLYRARFEGATPTVRLRDGRVIVAYRGVPFDWRKRVATVAMSTTIPWRVDVVGGIQRLEADLRALDLRRFELTGGTERVQLELGRPTGEVVVRVVGGANTLRFERPAGVPVRVHLRGGTKSISVDGQVTGATGGDLVVSSRPDPGNASGPDDRYAIDVVGGSKSIEVIGRPDPA